MSPRILRAAVMLVMASVSAALAASPLPAQGPQTHTFEWTTDAFTVDRKYKSMEGPLKREELHLLKTDTPELLWITGYEIAMLGPDGTTPMSQEFLCHSDLDFSASAHNQIFRGSTPMTDRIFLLSQGQRRIELPKGYGIPVLSTEPLSLMTQILNLNIEGRTFQVRHKIKVTFVRDRDLKEPYKALYMTGPFGMVLVEGQDGYYGVQEPDPAKQGASCLMGSHAPHGVASNVFQDGMGRKFSGHWVVPPGRQVNHSLVTKVMQVPFDTTIHYITVHLHPFAESLELRDLTADKTVFTARATNFTDRLGLKHVEHYASPKGLPIYKDHEYELISTYNNKTDQNQDSMAVMLLYLWDKAFQKPTLQEAISHQPSAISPAPSADP